MKTMPAASKSPCLVDSLAKFSQEANVVLKATYEAPKPMGAWLKHVKCH